ncbi:lipocalin-like domain-containing protein [Dactylosporangium sp. CS-047395]|uniref:lipocalin-like domain-containing protein n=1 Tax=Dactylosporangium sp. CS-047395 TaxID=3239936 RepID=UPI003D8C23CC
MSPPGPEHLESWYLDARLDDGTVVTITFASRHRICRPGHGCSREPTATVCVNYFAPDGTHIAAETTSGEDAYAAADQCDVRIGPHRLTGGLVFHHVMVCDRRVSLDLAFTGTIPPTRIGTGRDVVSGTGRHTGWLVMAPHADVTGTISTLGRTMHVRGDGYHDHTWSDIARASYLRTRYRAHGRLGQNTLVFGADEGTPATGSITLPFRMLFQPPLNQIVTDRGPDFTVLGRRTGSDLIADRLRFTCHHAPHVVTIDVDSLQPLRSYRQPGLAVPPVHRPRHPQYQNRPPATTTI